jgi:hypothetical protein
MNNVLKQEIDNLYKNINDVITKIGKSVDNEITKDKKKLAELYYNNIINQIKFNIKKDNICEVNLNNFKYDFIYYDNKHYNDINEDVNWYKHISKIKYNIICFNNFNNIKTITDINNCYDYIRHNLSNNGCIFIIMNKPTNITLKYVEYLLENKYFEIDNLYIPYNNYNPLEITILNYPFCLILKKYNINRELKYIKTGDLDDIVITKLANKYIHMYIQLNRRIKRIGPSGPLVPKEMNYYRLYYLLLFYYQMNLKFNNNGLYIDNFNYIINKYDIKFNNIIVINCNIELINPSIKYKCLKDNNNNIEKYLIKKYNKNLKTIYNIIIIQDNMLNLNTIILAWKLLDLNGILVINNDIDNYIYNTQIIDCFFSIYQVNIKLLCNSIQYIIQKKSIY